MYEYYSLHPLELIANFWKVRAFNNFYCICEGGLGSRNSVRLSVTRVDCNKTK